MSALLVRRPGLLTTVQDLGRPGLGRFGVSPSGAMDPFALRAANRLAGNGDGAAALEITAIGPELEFTERTLFALAGGDLSASLDGMPVASWSARIASPGDILTFGPRRQGARCYLAVAGGILVPQVLGSRSTDLESRLGGAGGRPLRAGDSLPTEPGAALSPRSAPLAVREVYANPFVLRFLPARGPAAGTLEAFTKARFRLGTRVSRMGYRLEGANMPVSPGTLLSEPIPPGTIQLPPGGEPILLMADRPTVGGYLRLGYVIRADLPRAAQLITGHAVRFAPTSLEEARASLVAQEAILSRIAA